MKTIKARCGTDIKVSDEDFERLSQHRWYLHRAGKDRRGYAYSAHPYAVATINGRVTRMHRLVISAPDGLIVDHINRDTLDNRRENLRLADNSLNMLNAKDQERELPRNIHRVYSANGALRFRVEFFRDKVRVVRRSFATLEEAIIYRDGCRAALDAVGRKEPIPSGAKTPRKASATDSGNDDKE